MSDTMPDIQEMDMNYERFYLVPWPDCQKFEELDEEQYYVIPTYVYGHPACFVDAQWIANDYEDEG